MQEETLFSNRLVRRERIQGLNSPDPLLALPSYDKRPFFAIHTIFQSKMSKVNADVTLRSSCLFSFFSFSFVYLFFSLIFFLQKACERPALQAEIRHANISSVQWTSNKYDPLLYAGWKFRKVVEIISGHELHNERTDLILVMNIIKY